MANHESLTPIEKFSLVITVFLIALLGFLARESTHYHSILLLAASVGALGGLTHEIAQSGGKIMFFEREEDGMYLGSLAGAVLGAVAGILVVRGHLIESATGSTLSVSWTQLSYEVYTAGLALKGVVEAAGGNAVPKKTN
jgi:hypothetical protein